MNATPRNLAYTAFMNIHAMITEFLFCRWAVLGQGAYSATPARSAAAEMQRRCPRATSRLFGNVYAPVALLSKHSFDPPLPSQNDFFRYLFSAPLFSHFPPMPPTTFRPLPLSFTLLFVPCMCCVDLSPNLPRPSSRRCYCPAYRSSHCHDDFSSRARRLRPRLVASRVEHTLRQAHFPQRSFAPHHRQRRSSHAWMVWCTIIEIFVSRE